MYRDSDAPDYYHIADNFREIVTSDYMYSIGGVAGARNPNNAECFTAQPATLYENGFAAGGQNETCATYNMLKLTSGLFLFDQRADRNITVTQTTVYPKEDRTLLTIKGKGRFDLNVRVPHWATKGYFVKINVKDVKINAVPGSYLTLSRKWKNGDTVELRMPFKFYLEPVMDRQNIASLFYGPVPLAAQEHEPRTEWRKMKPDAEDICKSISGSPEQLEFTIDGVVFKPFYETYGRHSVYLDVTLK
ncbi:MAG: beta-L-arabinofuranosidase domain-containing protein [Bacteroidales bacterium]